MANKRKGDDDFHPSLVSLSSMSSSDSEMIMSQQETQRMMKEVRFFDFGDLLQAILDTHDESSIESASIMEEASIITSSLESEIQEAQSLYQNQMNAIYSLNKQVQELQTDVDDFRQALLELDEDESKSKERILEYKRVTSLQHEEMDLVETDRLKTVPKLKHQISLFAKATGIKWDYNEENLLAGEVVIPTLGMIAHFAIDPRDRTRFEIANYLWAEMEGSARESNVPYTPAIGSMK